MDGEFSFPASVVQHSLHKPEHSIIHCSQQGDLTCQFVIIGGFPLIVPNEQWPGVKKEDLEGDLKVEMVAFLRASEGWPGWKQAMLGLR